MSTRQVPTPELDKMREVTDRSHAIGEFLSWLEEEKGYRVMRWSRMRDWGEYDPDDPEGDEQSERGGVPVPESTQKLLAEFFGIDLQKVEDERRAILEAMRGSRE